jgi:hypothetical protein
MSDSEFHADLLQWLRARFEGERDVFTFDEWQDIRSSKEPRLDAADMQLIVEQAIATFQTLYVHLDLKRARRGVDPVRQLNVFKDRIGSQESPDSRTFHRRMLEIFKSLGDVHTAYRLPQPYIGAVAFLPFLLNGYSEDRRRRYVVTRTLWDVPQGTPAHPWFRRGVEVVRWNGTPIDAAVALSAEFEEGSNAPHDLALGLQFMTVRWFGASFEPDSPWVIVDYKDADGVARQERFWWSVLALPADSTILVSSQAADAIFGIGPMHMRQLAVHRASQIVHEWRRKLFVGDPARVDAASESLIDTARALRDTFRGYVGRRELQAFTRNRVAAADGTASDEIPSLLPMFLTARRHSGEELCDRAGESLAADDKQTIRGKTFGYIGIRAFPLQEPERGLFKYEFRRLLSLMPCDGLILDVRDNPGGSANNAEESLQFLTPRQVTPLPFRFAASASTRRLASRPEYKKYEASIVTALGTGGAFSAGLPITSPSRANAIGQHYFGPVLLVTNAATYSAGDIFAAGFEDNAIGFVLGVDQTTGAGGANCWAYQELIRPALGTRPLPHGVNMQFAVRQCSRIGDVNVGVPLEEIGVPTVDTHRYELTKDDILGDRPFGLLVRAAAELAKMESYDLETELEESAANRVVTVRTRGIDRLDLYLDDRPSQAVDVEHEQGSREGVTTFVLPAREHLQMELRGFARQKHGDKQVARYVQVFLQAATSPDAARVSAVNLSRGGALEAL